MRSALPRLGMVAVLLAAATATTTAAAPPANGAVDRAALLRFAALPASTFVSASEPSGSALGTVPINGVAVPFADQPVQGFSAAVRNRDGTFDVLSDNGYGTKANSADFVLRIHRVAPDFATGAIDVVGGINLSDPNQQVPFPLTRADRVLTGADFDPESMVRAGDGSYWLGEEFGPFLLHVDRAGRLLQPPVAVPGVFAPENPFRGDTPANLPSSKGFESLATSPDGRRLYPLLEGTVAGDPPGTLRMYEFDVTSGRFADRRWTYRMADPTHSVADAVSVDANRFLVIERDSAQGAAAVFKRVLLGDRRLLNTDGSIRMTPVADLLDLANPRHVGGFGEVFRFPFFTIETLVLLSGQELAVLNDNNFPSSAGRDPQRPDDDEFIVIRLPRPLHPDRRLLPEGPNA
jgi:hypothetical protein